MSPSKVFIELAVLLNHLSLKCFYLGLQTKQSTSPKFSAIPSVNQEKNLLAAMRNFGLELLKSKCLTF